MKTSGRIVSFSFFFFWVFVLPDLLYLAWPRINATIDQLAFIFHDPYFRKFTILILTTNFITLLTYNLVMYVIYVSKFDFFEQYRVSKVNIELLRSNGPGRKISKLGELCSKNQYF